MIVVQFQNGKTFSARGSKVGFWRRLALTFRIPVVFKSSSAEDRLLVQPFAVMSFQTMADDVAAARKAKADALREQEEREAQEQAEAGRLIRPGFRVPGRRPGRG